MFREIDMPITREEALALLNALETVDNLINNVPTAPRVTTKEEINLLNGIQSWLTHETTVGGLCS